MWARSELASKNGSMTFKRRRGIDQLSVFICCTITTHRIHAAHHCSAKISYGPIISTNLEWKIWNVVGSLFHVANWMFNKIIVWFGTSSRRAELQVSSFCDVVYLWRQYRLFPMSCIFLWIFEEHNFVGRFRNPVQLEWLLRVVLDWRWELSVQKPVISGQRREIANDVMFRCIHFTS